MSISTINVRGLNSSFKRQRLELKIFLDLIYKQLTRDIPK